MTQPVLVGAASRDRTAADRRGWRLGGPAAYAGLTLARLGLRPRILLGVDGPAAEALELEWLRDAGAELRLVPLGAGPVFVNDERAGGRIQTSEGPCDPITVAVPDEWSDAPAWLLLPVASELPAHWASVPGPASFVALGWQGLLRTLPPGGIVERRSPSPSPLLSRADLVVVSRFDLAPDTDVDVLTALLAPSARLVVTDGEGGGVVVDRRPAATPRLRRYPAIPPARLVDPTGAGDVFLAALVAAHLGHPLAGSGRRGTDLRFAAAVASLAVEAPGLAGVPDPRAVAARLRTSLGRSRDG